MGLVGGTVHVVRIALDTGGFDMSTLSDEERQRAHRFVFDEDRRRFVAAHSAMRHTIARALNSTPAAIRFARALHGKPELAGGDIDLRFNLSHSGERALLALTVGREVGIDIEQHRPIDVMSLSKSVFSPLEQDSLRQAEVQSRLEAFYRCWTRKESFIKARGDGLLFPLDGFDVSLEVSAPQLLLACRTVQGETERWVMIELRTELGYSAALTVEGRDWRLVEWDNVEAFVHHR